MNYFELAQIKKKAALPADTVTDLSNKQPLDSDLTTIAGLTATTDNIMQAKSGAWASRTLAQLWTDLKDLTVTLTNKTIALGSNTVSGTLAQFNTAVTDADLASLTGSETLTNKTVALGSNTVSGTRAQFNTAMTDDDFASLTGTETLTNKTVALGSNTVSGTTAQFNTANTDDDFATLTNTATLTNKRITKRVVTVASSATVTIDVDVTDVETITAQAAALTIAISGTPTAGQPLIIRIKDNGTARAITYPATFRAIGVTLPTTTVISKTTYLGLIYNSTDTKWDCIAVSQEA